MKLTPAGVALCGAIQLHINGSVALHEDEYAALSPALIRLIHHYATDRDGRGAAAGAEGTTTFTQMLAILQSETAAGDSASHDSFTPAAAAVLDIMQAVDSADALVEFFNDLFKSLVRKETATEETAAETATVWSAAGALIRRACLAFDRLPFEGVCSLFENIEEDVYNCTPASLQAAMATLSSRANEAAQWEQHVLPSPPGKQLPGHEQLPRGSKGSQGREEPEGLLEMKAALREDDFPAALDSLHSYFDATAETDREGDKGGRLQSALLSLAAMHLHFGHFDEALTSLNESVRRSQQQSDTACLTHCLAQLCALFAARGTAAASPLNPVDDDSWERGLQAKQGKQLRLLLHLCQRSAAERGLPHLTAYAQLAAARQDLVHGSAPRSVSSSQLEEAPPAKGLSPTLQVTAAVTAVHRLHMRTSIEAVSPAGIAPEGENPRVAALRMTDVYVNTTPMFCASLKGSEELMAAATAEAAAGAHTLSSAAWSAVGRPDLAATAAATVVGSYRGACDGGTGALDDEVSLAYAQLATIAYERRGYRAATEVLQMAKQALPGEFSGQLAAAELCILHQRACNRRQPSEAHQYLQRLRALSNTCSGSSAALAATVQAAVVRQAMCVKCYPEAGAAATEMFCICDKALLQAGCVQALQLQATIQLAANSPTEALAAALAAGHRAAILSADVAAAEAAVTAAAARLILGPQDAQRAVDDVAAVEPLLTAYGSLHARATAQATLGAALKLAMRQSPDTDILRLLGAHTTAAALYEELESFSEAAEQHYLAAMTTNAADHIALRDASAAEFLRLRTASESAAASTL